MRHPSEFSGKFILRTGGQLHARLARYAEHVGLSLNAACVKVLENGLASEEKGTALPFGLGAILSESFSLHAKVLGLILYGSWVRGESTEASDIDVLIVFDRSVKLSRALYSELDTLSGIDPRVSLMGAIFPDKTDRPGSLWLELAVDGLVASEKGLSISRLLARIRRHIVSGKVVRHESHGQGYWVYAQ